MGRVSSNSLSREKARDKLGTQWVVSTKIASSYRITWIWNLRLTSERWLPDQKALIKLELDLKGQNKRRLSAGTRKGNRTLHSTHTFKRKRRYLQERYHIPMRNLKRTILKIRINNLINTTRSLTSSTKELASDWWQSSTSNSSSHSRKCGLIKRRRTQWPISCSPSPWKTSKGYYSSYLQTPSKNLLHFWQ